MKRNEPEPGPRGRRFRVRYLVLLALVGLIGDAGYVAVRLASSLYDTSNALADARTAFAEADFERADREVQDALEAASQARSLTRHPAFLLAKLVPRYGRDARVVEAVSEAGLLAAEAGASALDAVAELDATDEETIAAALYRGGRVRIDEIRSPSLTSPTRPQS